MARISVWHLLLSLIIMKFAHPVPLLLHHSHTQRAILRAEKMILGRGAQRNSSADRPEDGGLDAHTAQALMVTGL